MFINDELEMKNYCLLINVCSFQFFFPQITYTHAVAKDG